MILALGDVYAQVTRREEAKTLMRDTQRRAREEQGCISYTFAELLDDPGHFLLVQQWDDQASLDAHYRSPAFAEYQARISPLLVRTSELQVHTVQRSVRPVASAPLDASDDD